MKRYLAILLTVCMALALAAACQPQGNDPGNNPSGNDSKYKDTVIWGVNSDQDYMDGQMNGTNDIVLRAAYSGLVKRNQENEIVGDLAESWTLSEDELVWTFTLRKGVKFHNGKEFTAADVKASYDRLFNTEEPVRHGTTMSHITDVVIVNDYTVELHTANPYPAMIASLCHRSNLILDADYSEEYGPQRGQSAKSVNGTGPYILKSWNVGEEMVFESFPDYYGGEAPTKNIILQVIADKSARAVALETGEIDITGGLLTEDVKRYIAQGEDLGVKVYSFDVASMHAYEFNSAHPIIQDKRIRQAISYAVDRHAMVEALYGSIGETPATAPMSSVVWGYHNFGVIEQDLDKSKQLLADAGYPDGFEFSIMVYENYNQALPAAEMIVSDLAKVGIKATIDVVDSAGFDLAWTKTSRGQDFPWGMFIMGHGSGTLDADECLRPIWETDPKGYNNNNHGWYSNERVDELLRAGAYEMDEVKRAELYKEAMQIIYIDDPGAVFTNNRGEYYCTSDKVVGFFMDARRAVDFSSILCLSD